MARSSSRVVALFGLPISNVDMRTAVASIHSRIQSGRTYQIATANLDFVRNARRDAALHRVICDCAMVLADGFPLLWAARLLRRPLKERVTGVDLTPELARLSAEHGYGIYLLGSTDSNAQGAMKVLREHHPGVNFVGQYAPPSVMLDDLSNEQIIQRIRDAKPHILLVAFGNPKQEFWIHRFREQLEVPVCIGIGGTLEILQEPARLLPRYAKDMWALVRHFPSEVLATRLQLSRSQSGKLEVEHLTGHHVIGLSGTISGSLCSEVRDAVTAAIAQRSDVTLDLSEATRIEPDGLGCLLDMRRAMQSNGLQFYVIGGSDSIRRVVHAGALTSLLPMATAGAGGGLYQFRTKTDMGVRLG